MITTIRAALASAILALAYKIAPANYEPTGSGGPGPFRPKN